MRMKHVFMNSRLVLTRIPASYSVAGSSVLWGSDIVVEIFLYLQAIPVIVQRS
jgi:hypothetical protein